MLHNYLFHISTGGGAGLYKNDLFIYSNCQKFSCLRNTTKPEKGTQARAPVLHNYLFHISTGGGAGLYKNDLFIYSNCQKFSCLRNTTKPEKGTQAGAPVLHNYLFHISSDRFTIKGTFFGNRDKKTGPKLTLPERPSSVPAPKLGPHHTVRFARRLAVKNCMMYCF